MGKTSKVMAGITSTALMLGIAGCGTNSDSYTDTSASPDNNSYTGSSYDSSNDSSYDSGSSTNYDSSNDLSYETDTNSNAETDPSTPLDSEYGDDLPAMPDDPSCTDWEWDQDDGVWQCADSGSGYYGHSYYGGHYYSNKSLLYNSRDYMAYKSSASFKGGISTSEGTSSYESNSVTRSSGFGSGSKSYGG